MKNVFVRYNVIGMQNFVNFCRFLWLRGKKEVLLENCTLRGIKGRESCKGKEQLYISISDPKWFKNICYILFLKVHQC